MLEIFERKEHVATIDAAKPVVEVQVAIREQFGLPAFVVPGA